MSKLPAFQFYPADWLNDIKLASCDLASKGLMIDIMCLMHQSEKYGYLLINGLKPAHKTVAKVLRLHHKTFIKSFNTLLVSGVLKTDDEGVVYCERMVKDQYIRDIRKEAGKLGGNPNLVNQKVKQAVNQKTTPSSSTSSSTSTSSLKTKEKKEKTDLRLPDFESFYSAHPQKKGKGQAEKTWIKLINSGELPDIGTLLAAIPNIDTSDMKFVKHPSTWLNAKGWLDEATPERQPERSRVDQAMDGTNENMRRMEEAADAAKGRIQ